MSNLATILQYQETDKKLFALENELASCDERKELLKAQKFLKNVAEKLESLEMKARTLTEKAEQMESRCESIEKALADFSGIGDLLEQGTADVSYYKKAAAKQLENLQKTKAELITIINELTATNKEFRELKKKTIAMQNTYAEANEKYKAVKASREDERKALEKELAEIAKKIPETTMAKYQTKRKEKIFPVVVPLHSGRCSSCGMELPLAAMSELDSAGAIECEYCHKMLYKE